MNLLQISTAVTVTLGPFLDSSDFLTPLSGLSIQQSHVQISKNAASFALKSNTSAGTHSSNGQYLIPLASTDAGTLGRLRVECMMAGALPVWEDFLVVTSNVWNGWFGTTSNTVMDLNTAQLVPGSPVASSVGAVHSRALQALPSGSPGVSGGLTTYDNVFGMVISGFVSQASPAASNFAGNSALSNVSGFFAGEFLVFMSGALKGIARKVTSYLGASNAFVFSGAASAADAPFPLAPANGDGFIIVGRHGS